MKVSINKVNGPLPIFGFLGALGGAGINAANQSALNEKQMAHDKEMAEINQANILEQMETQNQYQVDQWNRENAYNDPTAVRARYEAAGISAHSALGGAATGAGIAGGLSSAPSGSSTGHSSHLISANIGSSIAAGGASLDQFILNSKRIDAQNAESLANAKLAEEKALSETYDRNFIKPSIARLQNALADSSESESEIKKIELQWTPYMSSLESALKEVTYDSIIQSIAKSKDDMLNNKVIRSLNTALKDKTNAEIIEIAERVKGYALKRAYEKAMTEMVNNQSFNYKMDSALKQAQKGHYDVLKQQINKEIEYIGSKMALNEQQIKKIKNDIALGWSKYGAQVAQATSQEIRKWMFGFIPGVSKEPPVTFSTGPWVEHNGQTYTFAD